jgi:hypothetical protein
MPKNSKKGNVKEKKKGKPNQTKANIDKFLENEIADGEEMADLAKTSTL